MLFTLGGQPIGAECFEVDGERIATVRMVVNPEKPRGLL